MEGLTGAPTETWQMVNCGCLASLCGSVRQCERMCSRVCEWGRQRMYCVKQSGSEKERESLSVKGGVLVICHRIRYPDKAIREKQILQLHGFNSLVLHPDELLKNGVQLKLVLYERLQICLLSGLLPPVFIGCKGLLINLPLLLSGRRGRGERSAVFPPPHWCVRCTIPNKYTSNLG